MQTASDPAAPRFFGNFTRIGSFSASVKEITRHPEAFHRSYRPLACGGDRLNMRSTPAIKSEARKIRCSKGGGEQPAFAHILGEAPVEMGLHQPLGAAFGRPGFRIFLAMRKRYREPGHSRGYFCLVSSWEFGMHKIWNAAV